MHNVSLHKNKSISLLPDTQSRQQGLSFFKRYPAVRYIVPLSIALFYFIYPDSFIFSNDYLVIFLILFAGIPHGAADHIIFKHLKINFFGVRKLPNFILLYLLFGLGFSFIWILSPTRALAVFLLISIYHFGQEHLHELVQKIRHKSIFYFAHGFFVLGFPLLWNFPETLTYISAITGAEFNWSYISGPRVLGISILGFLILSQIYLALSGILSWKTVGFEIADKLLLLFIFVTTPLLLGFALYFVFWHSINAFQEQFLFLKSKIGDHFTLTSYLKKLVPFSLIAITGLISIFTILSVIGISPDIAFMFVFIAIITLPHILLFDRFYSENPAM